MVLTIPLDNSGQLSQLCPLLPTPTLLAECAGSEKQRKFQRCANTVQQSPKTLVCYQHYFRHKSKIQHHTGCFEERQRHTSQRQYTYKWLGCLYVSSLYISRITNTEKKLLLNIIKLSLSNDTKCRLWKQQEIVWDLLFFESRDN